MTVAAPAAVLARRSLDRGRLLRLVLTVATVAACAGAAEAFVLLPLTGRFTGPFEDFWAYMQGVTAMAHGQSPYAPFSGSSIVMSGFDYPPFAAVLLRPLASLGAQWQVVAFLWLSLASLLGGAVVTARTVLPESWPRARLGVLVALTFPPATYNLWHGQANTIIFLLLALALRDWQRGRLTRFAVIVGLAAGIKLAPAVLLVLLVRRERWRALAAGAATIAATALAGVLALGWETTRQWATDIVPVLGRDNGWVYNDSWNGAVNRLLNHSVVAVQAPSTAAHALTLLLSLLTGVLLLGVALRPATSAGERAAQLGVAVCAMVLVGSLSWYPNGVHLLIAVAAAAALGWERRDALRGGLASLTRHAGALYGVAALTVLGTWLVGVAVLGSAPVTAGGYSGVGGWLLLQLTSLPVLLTAALMVVLAVAAGPRLRGVGSAR